MNKHKIKVMSRVLFIVYICALIYFMFFAEVWGRTHLVNDYNYNLVPFKEITRFIRYGRQLGTFAVLANLGGNIVGFMPFGFIIPIISAKHKSIFTILVLTFDLSLFIELVQLVSKVGSFDVDDIILNTLGGVLGYIVFCIFNLIRRRLTYGRKS